MVDLHLNDEWLSKVGKKSKNKNFYKSRTHHILNRKMEFLSSPITKNSSSIQTSLKNFFNKSQKIATPKMIGKHLCDNEQLYFSNKNMSTNKENIKLQVDSYFDAQTKHRNICSPLTSNNFLILDNENTLNNNFINSNKENYVPNNLQTDNIIGLGKDSETLDNYIKASNICISDNSLDLHQEYNKNLLNLSCKKNINECINQENDKFPRKINVHDLISNDINIKYINYEQNKIKNISEKCSNIYTCNSNFHNEKFFVESINNSLTTNSMEQGVTNNYNNFVDGIQNDNIQSQLIKNYSIQSQLNVDECLHILDLSTQQIIDCNVISNNTILINDDKPDHNYNNDNSKFKNHLVNNHNKSGISDFSLIYNDYENINGFKHKLNFECPAFDDIYKDDNHSQNMQQNFNNLIAEKNNSEIFLDTITDTLAKECKSEYINNGLKIYKQKDFVASDDSYSINLLNTLEIINSKDYTSVEGQYDLSPNVLTDFFAKDLDRIYLDFINNDY